MPRSGFQVVADEHDHHIVIQVSRYSADLDRMTERIEKAGVANA